MGHCRLRSAHETRMCPLKHVPGLDSSFTGLGAASCQLNAHLQPCCFIQQAMHCTGAEKGFSSPCHMPGGPVLPGHGQAFLIATNAEQLYVDYWARVKPFHNCTASIHRKHSEFFGAAIDFVRMGLPFWNRSGGSDHYMVNVPDWGRCDLEQDHEHVRLLMMHNELDKLCLIPRPDGSIRRGFHQHKVQTAQLCLCDVQCLA